MQLELSEERQAQLSDHAERHGQDLSVALDQVLADALESERQDYGEAVQGICNGYADITAGRTRSLEESFDELRVKYGVPR